MKNFMIKGLFAHPLLPMLLLALLLSFPHSSHADYYRYTDRTGTACFTDKPDKVPVKYRSTMKIIREKTLVDRDKANRIEPPQQSPSRTEPLNRPEPEKQPAPQDSRTDFDRLTTRHPWLKPALFTGGAIILFLIARRLSTALSSPQLARLICIVFFLGIFVTIYIFYAKYITDNSIAFKKKILIMFEKANRREAPEPGEPTAPSVARDRSGP
jgi:Domain of unknown function (DUF4124)